MPTPNLSIEDQVDAEISSIFNTLNRGEVLQLIGIMKAVTGGDLPTAKKIGAEVPTPTLDKFLAIAKAELRKREAANHG